MSSLLHPQLRCIGDEDLNVKEAAMKAMDAAIKDGSNWVLKPQREGGGNNYYGSTLSAFLEEYRNDPKLSGWCDSSLEKYGTF